MWQRVDLVLLIMALLAGAIELAVHYFPWRKLRKGQDLRPPWTYVYGTTIWVGCLIGLSVVRGSHQATIDAIVILVAAGGAVLLAYGIDHYLEMRASLDDSKDKEGLHDGAR